MMLAVEDSDWVYAGMKEILCLKILVFNHSGNKSQFTTLKKGDASVQRCEKQLLVVYDEQSIMDRPGIRTLQFDHHVFPPSDAGPWEA